MQELIVYVFAIFLLGPLLILVYYSKDRRGRGPRKPEQLTMLYAPGKTDQAGEFYHSARKDGAMPFPVGKKKERKRTHTFRDST